MAVAFGSFGTGTTGTNTTGSSVTITAPSGIANGDILVCGICYNTNGFLTISPPAGWTTITAGGSGSDAAFDMAVFWKKASSESGNYVFTLSSGSENMSGGIARYTGADQTTPINVQSSAQHGTTSSVTSPSVTTTVDGCMIVGIYSGWSTPSATPPTGMTERIDIGQTNSSLTIDLEVADETQSTHGATGSFTATMSGATHCWGLTLAIAPAAGGGFTAKNRRTIGYRVGSRSYY